MQDVIITHNDMLSYSKKCMYMNDSLIIFNAKNSINMSNEMLALQYKRALELLQQLGMKEHFKECKKSTNISI